MATRAMLMDELLGLKQQVEDLLKQLEGCENANVWLNRELKAAEARLETLKEDRDKLLISHKDLNAEYTKALELQRELQRKLKENLEELVFEDEKRFELQHKLAITEEQKRQLLNEIKFHEAEHDRNNAIIDALICQLKHKG